uniref:Uncharacterized protein n=1 Tax=Rhizophora mucronata TaxID=61149 RepID=A0A2P2PNX7_RHIMU
MKVIILNFTNLRRAKQGIRGTVIFLFLERGGVTEDYMMYISKCHKKNDREKQ